MGRPERHDADYFPFYAKRGKTLNILQNKFGLEGIGFFTNLMRFLALTPDHHYCIEDETDRMNFFAEVGIQDEARGLEMIELMVRTEKLDRELWESRQVIASEAFLRSLEGAYKQRSNGIITINEIKEKFVSKHEKGVYKHENEVSKYENSAKRGDNPQSKVKKSKVKKSKLNSEATPPAVSADPAPAPTPEKAKKPPLREREPANDMERVEKAYIQNWDALYSQGRVMTPDPVVNWNQTRKLLKTHLQRLTPEQLIQAINNGMNDGFVTGGGYSLGTMLSASVLNRLINSAQGQPPDKPAEITGMIALWNKALEYWNERGIKPECRDREMRVSRDSLSEILRTFDCYTWDEIRNAIGNYAWHRARAPSDYTDPLIYGSLAGFLKSGVEKYFDDTAMDRQFKREARK